LANILLVIFREDEEQFLFGDDYENIVEVEDTPFELIEEDSLGTNIPSIQPSLSSVTDEEEIPVKRSRSSAKQYIEWKQFECHKQFEKFWITEEFLKNS
jgi:hypothetical protein